MEFLQGNLSIDFPNVDWDSYWRGLLSEDVIENWLNGEKAIVVMTNAGLMRGFSEAVNRHPSRAVRTAMYVWFLKAFERQYSGNFDVTEKVLWVERAKDRQEQCLEYVVSNFFSKKSNAR